MDKMIEAKFRFMIGSYTDIRMWSSSAQSDPYLVAVACGIDVNNIYRIPKELRDDFHFMDNLVQEIYSTTLYNHAVRDVVKLASKRLRNNKSFMMNAVLKDASSFEFAGKDISSSTDFIREIFENDIYIYPHLSYQVQQNHEFAKRAIKNGFPVHDLPKQLFEDKDIVKTCFRYGRARETYMMLPKKMQEDLSIVKMYVEKCNEEKVTLPTTVLKKLLK